MNSEKKRMHTRIVEEEEELEYRKAHSINRRNMPSHTRFVAKENIEYREAHCINGQNMPSNIKFVEELELENRLLKQELQSKKELEFENRSLRRELRFKNKLGLLGIVLTAEICKIVINKVATFVATFLHSEKEVPTKQNLILTNFI